MKELNSLLFKDFKKSKMSDYSKVYGGILQTYHSHTDPPNNYHHWDTKETVDGPETVTSQGGDSTLGTTIN